MELGSQSEWEFEVKREKKETVGIGAGNFDCRLHSPVYRNTSFIEIAV